MNLLIRTANPRVHRGRDMGSIRLIAGFGMLAAMTAVPISLTATHEDGVALAIVYDTSGSMKEPVRDRTGKLSPKYVIANRALEAVTTHNHPLATTPAVGGPRTGSG